MRRQYEKFLQKFVNYEIFYENISIQTTLTTDDFMLVIASFLISSRAKIIIVEMFDFDVHEIKPFILSQLAKYVL